MVENPPSNVGGTECPAAAQPARSRVCAPQLEKPLCATTKIQPKYIFLKNFKK